MTIETLGEYGMERMTDEEVEELFDAASETEKTRLYEFRIQNWTGIRHTGLPPRPFGGTHDDQ